MTRHAKTIQITHAYTGKILTVEAADLNAVRELTAHGEHVLLERADYTIEVPASEEMIDGEPEYANAHNLILDGVEFIHINE